MCKKYAKDLERIIIFSTFASDLHKVSHNSNNLKTIIMSIFNFWNKKKESGSAMIATLPVINPETSATEEVETNQVKPDTSSDHSYMN